MTKLPISGYEKVIEVLDDACGLHAFIAIHSTALGPSLGGMRIYPYQTRSEALEDVLRLSKAMSYKSALAETGLGGGKSVILAHPLKEKSETLLLSFAEAINSLHGSYIAAEDVGSTVEDMLILHQKTRYVVAMPTVFSSGDPSKFTAFGVLRGIQAVSQFLFHSHNLKGKRIAIQGLGNVGAKIAELLFWEGAELILTDLDPEKLALLAFQYKAETVSPEKIFDIECDIFSPCALGGILNQETIPRLRCKAIAGSANNQLQDRDDGILLFERKILHAPGYVINAGGIINAASEFNPGGYNPKAARDKTGRIYSTLIDIFTKSREENKPPAIIADQIAEFKLLNGIGKRSAPLMLD